ncbi:unnamed protein product [Paramecium sonneborni]|uniref:Transmembrane protein n=1 Tax=Paramecium sonneborni TaxID=65129 RepID=A0A8S1L1I7_9CILI|nr:unnamed protein product [Paramecium sonneborni]
MQEKQVNLINFLDKFQTEFYQKIYKFQMNVLLMKNLMLVMIALKEYINITFIRWIITLNQYHKQCYNIQVNMILEIFVNSMLLQIKILQGQL